VNRVSSHLAKTMSCIELAAPKSVARVTILLRTATEALLLLFEPEGGAKQGLRDLKS